jgi:glycosyltransferase involved in cell wall biosynthesis
MHISHVTSALAGGPATSLGLLSAQQAKDGHKVSLVYSSIRDEIWPYRRRFDHVHKVVPWRVARSIGLRDVLALVELVRILDRLAPDIVHLHCSKAGALGRLAARTLAIPAVYSPRGVSFVRTDRMLQAQLYRAAEMLLAGDRVPIVACSESEADHLRSVARSVYVVPNGVDLTYIRGLEYRAHSGDSPFTIGILGLIKDQRMPRFVRFLAEHAPREWRWSWIGDGPLRAHLEGLPNLVIAGWREHREGLQMLLETDVVLHASRWEGMPNALLEAMALGMPVVASDVVGTRDVITHEVDGLLIRDVYNAAPYLSALSRLAGDVELRAGLGRRARERVIREYDASVTAKRWDEIYEAAIARRPREQAAQRGKSPLPAGAIADLSALDA